MDRRTNDWVLQKAETKYNLLRLLRKESYFSPQLLAGCSVTVEQACMTVASHRSRPAICAETRCTETCCETYICFMIILCIQLIVIHAITEELLGNIPSNS